jgi:hypothetical protein
MSIITPYEVKKYSPAGAGYPLDNINLFKDSIERDFFMNCIGEDYYNLMLKDARRFETATIWNKTTSYNSGDHVIYQGQILESCQSLNVNSEPIYGNDKWQEAAKFSKKAYNAIWNTYLNSIIAFKIYKECIPFDTIKSDAKGLQVFGQDGSGAMTANKYDVDFLQKRIQNQIDLLVDGFKKYVIAQYELFKVDPKTGYDFSLMMFVEDCEKCIVQSKSNRRVSFLN